MVLGGFVDRGQETTTNGSQGNQESQQSYDPELVKRAKELGWRDRSEFRGPEDRWVEPDEFVRRGEEVLPIVKSQLDRERERVAELERRTADRERSIDERFRKQQEDWEKRLAQQERDSNARSEANAKVAQLALQRQRDRFMADLDVAKRSVVPEEGRAHYDELVRREQEFYRAVAVEEEQIRAPVRQPDPDPEPRRESPQQQSGQRQLSQEELSTVNDWRQRNTWFDTKTDANRLANIIHVNILEEQPHLSLRDNLDLVTKEMQRRFPEKIGINPEPQRQNYQDNQQREFYGNNSQEQRQGQQENGQRQDSSQQGYQSQQGNDQGNGDRQQQRQHSSVEAGQSFANNNSSRQKKGWGQIHPNDRNLFEASVFPTGVYGRDLAKARELWANDYHAAYEEQ